MRKQVEEAGRGARCPDAHNDLHGRQKPRRPRERVTSRFAWAAAAAVVLLSLVVRIGPIHTAVTATLENSSEITANLSDTGLRRLAINVGLILALLLVACMLLLYQSLGRALENNVYAGTIHIGKLRVSLFYLVAAAATIPFHLGAAFAGVASLRGSAWYFWTVGLVSTVVPLSCWQNLKPLSRRGRAIVIGCCFTYGMLATLI
jgi:hypothetical protein